MDSYSPLRNYNPERTEIPAAAPPRCTSIHFLTNHAICNTALHFKACRVPKRCTNLYVGYPGRPLPVVRAILYDRMDALSRVFSRPQAKPYRSGALKQDPVQLDENGLLKWGEHDIENPKNWSRARRWYITIICIVLVTNASMASSSPSGCLPSISEELRVSTEVSKLTVTLFVLGFASGPSLWAPLSEFYGRRRLYITTFTCYFAFTFLCAFTPNIAGLLIGRLLCGIFISGALSNTPGVFADLWGPIERGNCMTFFTCALQMGPAIVSLSELEKKSFLRVFFVSG